ncbi:MAG: NAD(P)/FAD-dependent oxidoreductase [Thermodesulfovibrionales bacterium]
MGMSYQLVIIGAGPAGLSAAIQASSLGVRVLVIDENDRAGGQLFLQTHKFFGSKLHMAGIRGFQISEYLIEQSKKYGVEMFLNTVVWGIYPDMRVVYATEGKKKGYIFAKNILIATGALKKAICFEGWTKPGVMGAGAAQYMMHIHRVLPGKNVLIVGSRNVGLIVSYQLVQAGAQVVGVIDALLIVKGYQVHAGKIRRLGVPILTSHTIVETCGNQCVDSAIIARVDKYRRVIGGSEQKVICDTICLAAGLRPFDELCWSLGLRMYYSEELGGFVPLHNEELQTSHKGVYVAGDVAGIEEANTAMEEGRLVGTVVAERLEVVDKKKAYELKCEIKRRFCSLRMGSYGEGRAIAKENIYRAFKNERR